MKKLSHYTCYVEIKGQKMNYHNSYKARTLVLPVFPKQLCKIININKHVNDIWSLGPLLTSLLLKM